MLKSATKYRRGSYLNKKPMAGLAMGMWTCCSNRLHYGHLCAFYSVTAGILHTPVVVACDP